MASRNTGSKSDYVRQYVCHYTDLEGKNGILKDMKINPSLDTLNDARYGPGVCLTSMSPNASTADIKANNWPGVDVSDSRADYAIQMRNSQMQGMRNCSTSRDVKLVPGTYGIDLNNKDIKVFKRCDGEVKRIQ